MDLSVTEGEKGGDGGETVTELARSKPWQPLMSTAESIHSESGVARLGMARTATESGSANYFEEYFKHTRLSGDEHGGC
ncbi:hypothetical protein AAHA92_16723 [Salvia divinorum]|uniref:Uncharacterized protein n=1 Tax=Salvia divinorum TaxID=28513 RepID=A0ABD1GWG3_SALDI